MPAPRVLIDGEPIEARWARIHVELEPGAHTLRVEVPLHSNGPRRPDPADIPTKTAEAGFTAAAGETALVEVLAEVVQDFDGRTYEYELTDLTAAASGTVAELPTFRHPRPPLRPEGEAFQNPSFNFSLEVN
ncbi:hypothetical protein AB0B28_20355 [Glycomyces sp. NPDC046736]|uniref:hypothetical protein n=1 Tax=Glycomyces sp. NPDC046736 TaxID=3155615 RepID=UPI0033D82197